MLPLNYAILQLFLNEETADVTLVMDRLADRYGKFRQFTPKAITEALMTAEANDLLEETGFELDETGQLRVYYRASESGRAMISRYIGGADPA